MSDSVGCGSREGRGGGSPGGSQRDSQQLEVPPSNWTPPPPLGPPSGPPNGEPGAQHPGVGPGPSMEGPKEPQQQAKRYKKIQYEFYSKPTGSRFLILESSAAPYQQKKSVLAQEVVRRLMNTSEDSSLSTRMHILSTYDRKLTTSGYSKAQRLEIIESGLVGYARKVKRQGGKRHRKGSDTKKERIRKKISGKTSWFKKRSATGKRSDTPTKTGGGDKKHWKRKDN